MSDSPLSIQEERKRLEAEAAAAGEEMPEIAEEEVEEVEEEVVPEKLKKIKPPKKTIADFPAPKVCDPCTLNDEELRDLETAPCSPRRSPLGHKIGDLAHACGCEIDIDHVACDCPICRNLDLSDAPLLL